jgi:putative peptidoglycan lipid II flippase
MCGYRWVRPIQARLFVKSSEPDPITSSFRLHQEHSQTVDGQQLLSVRWRELFVGSLNRRIFSATVIIGALTLGVKLASMLKEMLVAAWFGTGDALDAFVIAFMVPSYIINVVAGSFNAALIPVHVDVRENQGPLAAQRLFSGTVALNLAILLTVTLCLGLLGPVILPLLCSGFASEKMMLTERLFYLLLPAIVISGVLTNWESVLNAGERFGIAALAPLIVPVTTVGVLSLLGARCGIDALAIGTVAGLLLQLLVLGRVVTKRGIKLLPCWHGFDVPMKRVLRQYLPLVGAAALMCSNLLVDQAMATMLAPGSVAALNYGNKLVALVLTVGTMALGTAVLPYFSKMVAATNWPGLRHTLMTYTRLVLLVTVSATCLGLWLSKPLVSLLFQRGNFTAADVQLVSSIQSMYMLQVPFYTLGILFVRMISSLQVNHVLLWNTIIGFTVNVVLNYLLMSVMGVAGIALSTSLVYAACCTFLATALYRKLRRIELETSACG